MAIHIREYRKQNIHSSLNKNKKVEKELYECIERKVYIFISDNGGHFQLLIMKLNARII